VLRPRAGGVVVAVALVLGACSVPPAPGPTLTTTSPTTSPTRSSSTTAPLDVYAGTESAVVPRGVVTSGSMRTADGRTRTYRLFVPEGITDPAPLLVALHGGLGSGEQFAAASGFDGLATANAFVVVYPDGIGSLSDGDAGIRTWNGGDCCGPAVRDGVDDVAFVRALVPRVAAGVPIDFGRVFATGHSNGGILALRLACEAADTFAAVGVQAAALGVPTCGPQQPMSTLMIHGTADRNIPIDGGKGVGPSGVVFTPPREGAARIARADGCDVEASSTTDIANPDLVLMQWTGCPEGVAVQFLAVTGASHAWMGQATTSAAAERLVGPVYPDLNTSRAIWAFVSAHARE